MLFTADFFLHVATADSLYLAVKLALFRTKALTCIQTSKEGSSRSIQAKLSYIVYKILIA